MSRSHSRSPGRSAWTLLRSTNNSCFLMGIHLIQQAVAVEVDAADVVPVHEKMRVAQISNRVGQPVILLI